jgi:hypothetical protein
MIVLIVAMIHLQLQLLRLRLLTSRQRKHQPKHQLRIMNNQNLLFGDN